MSDDIRQGWLDAIARGEFARTSGFLRRLDPLSAHETGLGWDPIALFLPITQADE